MLVWGGVGDGGVEDGWRLRADGEWEPMPAADGASSRVGHSATWTGSEMIIWGGFNGNYVDQGEGYSPVANEWRSLSRSVLNPRGRHCTVWTGDVVLVWGGGVSDEVAGALCADGAFYDPLADRWGPISSTGAPAARRFHTCVWTGSEMLVWGGMGASGPLSDGGRYSWQADTWTAIERSSLSGRYGHSAIWTGGEMIVFGGMSVQGYAGDGGAFAPTTGSWRLMTPAAVPREGHVAIWTGTMMLAWGGMVPQTDGAWPSGTGAYYVPDLDRWGDITEARSPMPRYGHTAVWTGHEMLAWGGTDLAGRYFSDGGAYAPEIPQPPKDPRTAPGELRAKDPTVVDR